MPNAREIQEGGRGGRPAELMVIWRILPSDDWPYADGAQSSQRAIHVRCAAPAVEAPLPIHCEQRDFSAGGVGCGKTMLMDLFYDTIPPHIRKKRVRVQIRADKARSRMIPSPLTAGALPRLYAECSRAAAWPEGHGGSSASPGCGACPTTATPDLTVPMPLTGHTGLAQPAHADG